MHDKPISDSTTSAGSAPPDERDAPAIARRGVVVAGLGLLSSASLAALLGGARDGGGGGVRGAAVASS